MLARLCLDHRIDPRALISLNGALLPLRGLAGHWFAPAARFLAKQPVLTKYFAWRAQAPRAIKSLLASTGSTLDDQGMEFYRRLVTKPSHLAAAIGMMANWDLRPLEQDLPRLATPLVMLVAEGDTTVSPAEARRVRALLPSVEVETIPRLWASGARGRAGGRRPPGQDHCATTWAR